MASPAEASKSGTSALARRRRCAAYRALSDARALYAGGRFVEAVEAAQRAVALDAESAAAWAGLAKAASRATAPSVFAGGDARRYRRLAREAAERAVSRGPDLYEPHTAQALVYRELGETGPWRAAAQRAIDINPRQAEGYALLGDSYGLSPAYGCDRSRDGALYESLYREVLRLDPSVHLYHRNFTSHLALTGRPEAALEHITEALSAYPESRPLRRAQAFVLSVAGRWQEAEQTIREGLRGEIPNLEERVFLASAELRRGRTAVAEREFEKAIAEGFPQMRLFIAAHCAAAGHTEGARRYVAEMIEIEPACASFLATTETSFHARLRGDPIIARMIAAGR